MRHYCAGDKPIPNLVMLALEQIQQQKRTRATASMYDPRLNRKEFRQEAFEQLILAYGNAYDPNGLRIMLPIRGLMQEFENIEATWEGRAVRDMRTPFGGLL
jgi:hypothetical protein